MSTCLISVGDGDSFVHEASHVLAREFGIELRQTILPEAELRRVVQNLRPDDPRGVTLLGDLLKSHGFDLERLCHNCSRWIVVSENIVPVDLLTIQGRDVGRDISISHIAGADLTELIERGRAGLMIERYRLSRVAFLPITELPYNFPRSDQDLIKAALRLSDAVGVDLLIQPRTSAREVEKIRG